MQNRRAELLQWSLNCSPEVILKILLALRDTDYHFGYWCRGAKHQVICVQNAEKLPVVAY